MRTLLLEQSVSLDKPVSDEEGRVLIDVLEDPNARTSSPTEDLEWEALTTEVRELLARAQADRGRHPAPALRPRAPSRS